MSQIRARHGHGEHIVHQNTCFRDAEKLNIHSMPVFMEYGGSMQNTIRVIFLCVMFGGLAACATVTIDGDVPKTADSTTGTDTEHGSFYNFSWSSTAQTKCENGQGLARVRTHTNVAYSLVSILTLGLYVPQTVTWWCDGTPEDDADEQPWVPPGTQ